MTTLHTEKTEAFYQKVLKINLDAAMHSSRAHGLEEPLEQLRLEAEWSADEVAFGLEIRLTDALNGGRREVSGAPAAPKFQKITTVGNN